MIVGLLFLDIFWTSGILKIQHYIAILFIFGTFVTLFLNRNIFTLSLGLTLIIGNFGGLSILPEITTTYLIFNIGSLPLPLYYGQFEFSILLLIYIVFDKEFYIGIATKEYWKNFLTRTKDLEMEFTVVNGDDNIVQNKSKDDRL